MLDALLGQIFLVTLVARLVAMFGTERRRPGDNITRTGEAGRQRLRAVTGRADCRPD